MPDGGIAMGGYSVSPPGGNKTSADFGAEDFWVIRMDASGNKLWDLSFGGTGVERLESLVVTSDGGLALGGWSNSDISGNKTTPNIFFIDFWIIRLDSAGAKLWERTFGGVGADILRTIQQTPDGGFIVGGQSTSSLPFADPGLGLEDFLLVRLDGEGNPLWWRFFGGPSPEIYTTLVQTPDGGFLLGGGSASAQGPTKDSPSFGWMDGWIVRVDANGNKLWDRSFGGSGGDVIGGIELTPDGGFLLVGTSVSPADGNKTIGNFDTNGATADGWVIRVDSAGNKLWEMALGGTADDSLTTVKRTSDGGFIIGGGSDSPISGNKTSPYHGGNGLDYWVVRLDAAGNKLWDQTFGGSDFEYFGDVNQTADGGYLLGGGSMSLVDGNKTEPSFGFADFWVLKLQPEIDQDCDGVPDIQDLCPNTDTGVIVDSAGCSIPQIAPCEGPWRSHGDYLEAVGSAVLEFRRAHLISPDEARAILRDAAKSDCGK